LLQITAAEVSFTSRITHAGHTALMARGMFAGSPENDADATPVLCTGSPRRFNEEQHP
jgi:hypothetical protein